MTLTARVLSESDEPQLELSVTDTGPGVPPSAQSTIFEPFATGVTGETMGYEGTGLGLSIVKRSVEAMGGEIALESETGEGSTFSVSIPLVWSDQNAPAAETEIEKELRFKGQVLLVDDMQTNLMLNGKLLESLGLQVETDESGEAAVERIKADPSAFDLVLMDWNMPGISGLEAAAEMRECPGVGDLPIIALTAFSGRGDREKARDAGMDGLIVKPVSRVELMKELTNWLPSEQVSSASEGENTTMENDAGAAFDMQKLDLLVQDLGRDVTRTLVDKFLAESARRWEGLRSAITAGDVDCSLREAHTLGSACLTFGLVGAGNSFRAIEATAKAGELPELSDVDQIAPTLTEGISALEAALRGS